MVSSETLRGYPLFAGLTHEQVTNITRFAEEVTLEQGDYLFYEGIELSHLYLVAEGRLAITLYQPEVVSRAIIPAPGARVQEVAVSVSGPGELVGWSSLVPPYQATSSARAISRCRCLSLKAAELRLLFELDPRLGYQVLLGVAKVARDRIQDLHFESLSRSVGA